MDQPRSEPMADRDLLMVKLPERAEERQDEVRALFEAHVEYGRLRRTRGEVEWAVVLSSILPSVSLVWPSAIPMSLRLLTFLAWAGLVAALAWAWLSERRWLRRMLERAETLHG